MSLRGPFAAAAAFGSYQTTSALLALDARFFLAPPPLPFPPPETPSWYSRRNAIDEAIKIRLDAVLMVRFSSETRGVSSEISSAFSPLPSPSPSPSPSPPLLPRSFAVR